jgi:hypothetical protein
MPRYLITWRDSEDNSETIWSELEARSLAAATAAVADRMPPPYELVSVQESEFASQQVASLVMELLSAKMCRPLVSRSPTQTRLRS